MNLKKHINIKIITGLIICFAGFLLLLAYAADTVRNLMPVETITEENIRKIAVGDHVRLEITIAQNAIYSENTYEQWTGKQILYYALYPIPVYYTEDGIRFNYYITARVKGEDVAAAEEACRAFDNWDKTGDIPDKVYLTVEGIVRGMSIDHQRNCRSYLSASVMKAMYIDVDNFSTSVPWGFTGLALFITGGILLYFGIKKFIADYRKARNEEIEKNLKYTLKPLAAPAGKKENAVQNPATLKDIGTAVNSSKPSEAPEIVEETTENLVYIKNGLSDVSTPDDDPAEDPVDVSEDPVDGFETLAAGFTEPNGPDTSGDFTEVDTPSTEVIDFKEV